MAEKFTYGEYDAKNRCYHGDDGTYRYTITDTSGISFRSWVGNFEKTLPKAFECAVWMLENEGAERVEIGTPDGTFIEVDARNVDVETLFEEEV